MSIISFNIGLSLLSRNENRRAEARSETAFRVLSLLEGRSITDDDISKEKGGRPYFNNGDKTVDFNISHSGDIVAVSHVRGISGETSLRTGCDIQLVKVRTNTSLIAEQFFSPAEREYIFTQKEQGNFSAFFEIWALKECYIKLHGLSVFDMASAPEFADKDGNLKLTINGISFFLFKLNDNGQQYVLAVAIKGTAIVPSTQWFSEDSLPCRLLTKLR